MTLGDKIKTLRLEHKMSQEALANKLFISRQTVTKWETNKSLPDIPKLAALSKFFETGIDSLLSDVSFD